MSKRRRFMPKESSFEVKANVTVKVGKLEVEVKVKVKLKLR